MNYIPFTLDELLAWVKCEQSVVPVALPPDVQPASPLPQIRAPGATETNIEAPWQLILSPSQRAAWAHANRSVTRPNGLTELWHTRLAVRNSVSGQ